MIKLDQLIGDMIFVSFKNIDPLKDIGITSMSGHYNLKGFDQLGIWLGHPGIVLLHNEDDNGNPVPISEQKKENISADFVVTWNNINTIMHYPNREGYDFPDKFNNRIGFESN